MECSSYHECICSICLNLLTESPEEVQPSKRARLENGNESEPGPSSRSSGTYIGSLSATKCGHVYHEQCIKSYLQRERKRCPNCQREGTSVKSLLKIFLPLTPGQCASCNRRKEEVIKCQGENKVLEEKLKTTESGCLKRLSNAVAFAKVQEEKLKVSVEKVKEMEEKVTNLGEREAELEGKLITAKEREKELEEQVKNTENIVGMWQNKEREWRERAGGLSRALTDKEAEVEELKMALMEKQVESELCSEKQKDLEKKLEEMKFREENLALKNNIMEEKSRHYSNQVTSQIEALTQENEEKMKRVKTLERKYQLTVIERDAERAKACLFQSWLKEDEQETGPIRSMQPNRAADSSLEKSGRASDSGISLLEQDLEISDSDTDTD